MARREIKDSVVVSNDGKVLWNIVRDTEWSEYVVRVKDTTTCEYDRDSEYPTGDLEDAIITRNDMKRRYDETHPTKDPSVFILFEPPNVFEYDKAVWDSFENLVEFIGSMHDATPNTVSIDKQAENAWQLTILTYTYKVIEAKLN